MPGQNTKDYYGVLQITRDASPEEISSAYKKMALKWHPDRHITDKAEAKDKFVEVHDAYKVLQKKAERMRHHVHFDENLDPSSRMAGLEKTGSPGSNRPRRRPSQKLRSDSTRKSKPDENRNKQNSTRSTCSDTKTPSNTSSPSNSIRGDADSNPKISPLRPIRHPVGASRDWIFPLPLSLEELFHGTRQRYRIGRHLLSGEIQTAVLDVEVPPGCKNGTQIRAPGVGNQRTDGSLQDIVFVIQEQPHDRFVRVKDDLITLVQLPCRKSSCGLEGDDVVYVEGLDGAIFLVPITAHVVSGAEETRIAGVGMPIRKANRVIGRGDLIIKWSLICAHKPTDNRWGAFRKAVHLKS